MIAEIYVIITERDLDKKHAYINGGAIIHETRTANAGNLLDVVERAKNLSNRYGETFVGKIEILGNLEKVEQLLKDQLREVNHGTED